MEFLSNAWRWIQANPDTVAEIGAALYALLSIVVGLTKTKEDDRWLKRIAQALSFLQPSNSDGTLKIPAKRPNPPPGENRQNGPRSPGSLGGGGGVAGLLLAASWVAIWPGTVGCSNPVQTGLNTGSTVLVELSNQAVSFYDYRDAVCRDRHPPLPETEPADARARRRDLYDACMEPVEVARTSRAALDRGLRAAQRAYNAHGIEGFQPKVPCLLETAEQLAAAVTEIFDEVPDELPDLIAFLRSYLTPGQECTDDHAR